MRKKKMIFKIVNTIWVGALAILFLMPLLWMVSSSLKEGVEVFSSKFQWIPDVIQWGNYKKVWFSKEVPFWKLYLNSFKIAVLGTIGQVMISSLAGYALAKIEFKGKNILFILILVTMMIPAQALIIPRYILFDAIGLYANHWALILPAWFSVTSIFLLRQFYMSLPSDLMEAARVDGANHFQIWLKVMMPLTKTPMITVTVLALINAWNEYLNAIIFLPNKELYTVAQGIQWFLQLTDEYNLMMAAAASAIIPIIVVFLFTQKYFVESIATTGVKG